MFQYKNPILCADYSDPDVIRVGEDFYMVSSSFNYVPGVPILHSKDLVHWEIINYVLDSLFPSFNQVRSGEGAWAPSIRYHNQTYYVCIPFPDEGIFVCESKDPYGKWSNPRCLLKGKGYEDPCPIWIDGKTYIVFAFVKSRIGFNSKLGLIEVTGDLTKCLSESYSIIYDGSKLDPTIEGPKCYLINSTFYILAPAGGVEHGYQVALKGNSVYGPFERMVILKEGDNDINGPHQGALVDINDKGEYAFIHFSDKGPLGRITCLEPCSFNKDNWPICGLDACPVLSGKLDLKETKRNIEYSDKFNSKGLSLIWQTPGNVESSWLVPSLSGLLINGRKLNGDLSSFKYILSEKLSGFNLSATLCFELHLKEQDELLFGIFGQNYIFTGVKFINGSLKRILRYKEDGLDKQIILGDYKTGDSLKVFFNYPSSCSVLDGKNKITLNLVKEHWTGLHLGICCISNSLEGYAILKDLEVNTTMKYS